MLYNILKGLFEIGIGENESRAGKGGGDGRSGGGGGSRDRLRCWVAESVRVRRGANPSW